MTDLAAHLGCTIGTVRKWLGDGLLTGRQETRHPQPLDPLRHTRNDHPARSTPRQGARTHHSRPPPLRRRTRRPHTGAACLTHREQRELDPRRHLRRSCQPDPHPQRPRRIGRPPRHRPSRNTPGPLGRVLPRMMPILVMTGAVEVVDISKLSATVTLVDTSYIVPPKGEGTPVTKEANPGVRLYRVRSAMPERGVSPRHGEHCRLWRCELELVRHRRRDHPDAVRQQLRGHGGLHARQQPMQHTRVGRGRQPVWSQAFDHRARSLAVGPSTRPRRASSPGLPGRGRTW